MGNAVKACLFLVLALYVCQGGLKAAILADVMQGLTMIAVSFAIIVQGCIEVGGLGKVFFVNKDDGRLDFMNFDMDPTKRVTTTSALVGQLFMSLSIFGCQQNFVQRYCSMDSQKKVTKTLMYNIPVITVLFSLSWVVGMVVYATYASCDPYSTGYTEKFDEILPFFVEDRFNYLPGILGLFMASLFNGALSLNVSNLNSLATVTFEDFLRPIPWLKDLKDKHQLYTIKAIGVLYGFIIMGISFGVGLLDGVIEASMVVTSATSGPLLGVFIMALLIPCTNWKGAATGVIVGHVVTFWIAFGRLTIEVPPTPTLPLRTDGCTNTSFNDHILKPEHQNLLFWMPATTTAAPATTTASLFALNETVSHSPYDVINTTRATTSDPLTQLYSITYMYYSLIGCFVCILIGWTVSYFTGSESDLYDQELIHPIARKMADFFPGKKRKYADKTKDNKASINRSVSATTMEKRNGALERNGSSNPAFVQDVPMATLEVYRTKL